MWHIFDETRCRQEGWFDAYRSYFQQNDIDPRQLVKLVKESPLGEYAYFNVTDRGGNVKQDQFLKKGFFYPINDKPIEEGEYL